MNARSLARIARVFFKIGATSFGGGVVAYLRGAMVKQKIGSTTTVFCGCWNSPKPCRG